jgi:hypothetical protein
LERTTDHCHSVEPHRGIIRGVAGQTNSTLRGKLTLAVPGKDTISNVWIANTGTGKYSLACVSAIATELKLNLLFDNKGVYLLPKIDANNMHLAMLPRAQILSCSRSSPK